MPVWLPIRWFKPTYGVTSRMVFCEPPGISKGCAHGVMTPFTKVDVVRDKSCFAVIDGKGVDQGHRQQAMEMTIAKAKKTA